MTKRQYIVKAGERSKKIGAVNPLMAAMFAFPEFFTYEHLMQVVMSAVDMMSWSIALSSIVMHTSITVVDITDLNN